MDTCKNTLTDNYLEHSYSEQDLQTINDMLKMFLQEEEPEIEEEELEEIDLYALERQLTEDNTDTQVKISKLPVPDQPLLAWAKDYAEIDSAEEHTYQQPLSEQDWLNDLSNLYLEEDNLEDIDLYTLEPQLPVEDSDADTYDTQVSISEQSVLDEHFLASQEDDYDQAVIEQKLLDDLSNLYLEEGNLEDIDLYIPELEIPVEDIDIDRYDTRVLISEQSILDEHFLAPEEDDYNQAVIEQKLLDNLSNLYLEEDNLEEINFYAPEPQVPENNAANKAQKLNLPSIVDLSSKVGLASALFAGGFVAGGASSWALLSHQHADASSNKDQAKAAQVHTEIASVQTAQTDVKAKGISAPETMSTEPSFSSSDFQKSYPVVYSYNASTEANQVEDQTSLDYAQIKEQRVTPADLNNRSAWELTLMRNEIYARHGRQFKETKLKQYFESKDWYKPRHAPEKFPVSVISKTELENAIAIRDYQKKHGLLVDL